MATYTKLAFKGAATVFIIALLASLLAYGIRLLLAQNLSVEDYGLFYAVFSFLAFIAIFKTLGFDKAIIRFIPELLAKKKPALAKSAIIYTIVITIIVNLVTIGIIYLLASYLSIHFFHTEKAEPILKLLALAFFAESFFFVVKNAFQGFKNMFLFSGIDVVRIVCILTILMIGFHYLDGILVPVLAYLISSLIVFTIFFIILKKRVFADWSKYTFSINRPLMRKMFKYGLIVFTSGASASILGYTDTLLLTYFSGLTQVALYNVALPLSKLMLYVGVSIGSILLPLTAEMYASKKILLVQEGLQSIYKYVMIAIMPVVAIMLFFATLIISLLFGTKFTAASGALQILSIAMFFGILQLVHMNFFMGINKPKTHAKIFFVGAGMNLLLCVILIPRFDMIGAAIATLASYLVMMIWGILEVKKIIGIEFPWLLSAKILLSSVLFLVSMWILKRIIILPVWFEAFAVVSFSSIVYAAALFLLKVVTIKEIKSVVQRIL